jgi:outer membrane receptor protein involved in Fe transport
MVDRITNNSALPYYNNPDFKQHQLALKLTHQLSAGSQLSGSYIWTRRPRTLVDAGGIWNPNDSTQTGGPLARSRLQKVGSDQVRFSHSHTLSSSLINVANVTFSRYNNPSVAWAASGDWPQKLGFGDPGKGNFPDIQFGNAVNGISTTRIGYGANSSYEGRVYILNDSLGWVKNRHAFKFGADFRHSSLTSHTATGVLSFNFQPDQTRFIGPSWQGQTGFGFASFLLGAVNDANQVTPGDLSGRRDYLALYAQDDVRVNDKLTFNLGLRWETTGPWTEKNGHWASYDTSAISPKYGIPGALVYASSGSTSFEGNRDWKQLGPRFGASYQVTKTTVLRGAYGIFYQPIGADYWAGTPYAFSPGFRADNRVSYPGSGKPAFSWDSGYPGVDVVPTKDPDLTQWGMTSMSKNGLEAGMMQQWNAGVEREVFKDLVVGIEYLGNKGTHLNSGDLVRNQPDMAALTRLLKAGKEWSWVADATSAAAAGVPYPYPGFSNYAFMALTPYPRVAETWGPLYTVGAPLGSQTYHALQLTANKRMTKGLAASAAYTYSRSRSNIDSGFQESWGVGLLQDVTQLDAEAKIIDANDMTHVFKGFATWQLPVGHGHRFLDRPGALDAVLGGWQLSVMVKYISGSPIGVTSSNSYTGWTPNYGYPIYVNADPNGNYSNQFDPGRFDITKAADPVNRYFDPKLFSNPAYGEFGKGPRYFEQLRTFSRAYENLGLLKNFRVAGRFSAQVRFELINVFNRKYFSNPITTINNPSFGNVISLTGEPRQGQIGLRLEW